MKLCECGCGQPAPIAKQSKTAWGWIKGQPIRFIHGHSGRVREIKPYVTTYRAVQRDGILRRVHRIRAERALDKRLPPKAVVHHVDEDPWNSDARLVICDSHAFHMLLHVRARVLRAGGNPNTDAMCGGCQMPKPITDFAPSPNRSTGRSHLCHACDALKAVKRRQTHAAQINALRRAGWKKKRLQLALDQVEIWEKGIDVLAAELASGIDNPAQHLET